MPMNAKKKIKNASSCSCVHTWGAESVLIRKVLVLQATTRVMYAEYM